MTDNRITEGIAPDPARRSRFGLSGKLLVLTILFVMLAEVLIYVPSIANFRLNWLNDRLAAAHTAALVLDAAPSGMVPESLARQMLDSIGARAVAMKMGQQRRMLAVYRHAAEGRIAKSTCATSPGSTRSSMRFARMIRSTERSLRVIGPAPRGGEFVEIIIENAPLQKAMLRFSWQYPAAVADHLGDHGGAGLSRAALSVRAPDAPHHREHDGVPRRSGESRARDHGLRAAPTRSA